MEMCRCGESYCWLSLSGSNSSFPSLCDALHHHPADKMDHSQWQHTCLYLDQCGTHEWNSVCFVRVAKTPFCRLNEELFTSQTESVIVGSVVVLQSDKCQDSIFSPDNSQRSRAPVVGVKCTHGYSRKSRFVWIPGLNSMIMQTDADSAFVTLEFYTQARCLFWKTMLCLENSW